MNYKETHHSIGIENGKRVWVNPVEKGVKNLDDRTAKDLNAQFENTGIKYIPIEEEKEKEAVGTGVNDPVKETHIVTEEDIAASPELAEKGIKVGDEIEITESQNK